ncbi:MAG: amidohydrolase [Prevotella sp.]|nr:amidohydrolase [Prevotella sp.]
MHDYYPIIDAHSHLWLRQDTEVDGKRIRTLHNGRSEFMGEERQMLPPFMTDGRNTAEVFLSNMDYAQVSAAVIVQEFIDGIQNDYLAEVRSRYPHRFKVTGLLPYLQSVNTVQVEALLSQGFCGMTIPGHRLRRKDGSRLALNSQELMQMYQVMDVHHAILSLALEPGTGQIAEVEDIIHTFPDLKIAIAHFGMVGSEGWMEQIRLARHENVMIESGGITWLFNDEFYPFPGAIRAIREAADEVGMEKLMWGSDYPRTITAITYRMSYDFFTKSKAFSDKEKRLFLGENARRFYQFEDPVHLPYIKNMSE